MSGVRSVCSTICWSGGGGGGDFVEFSESSAIESLRSHFVVCEEKKNILFFVFLIPLAFSNTPSSVG